jgi:hypothetical protein
MAQLEAKKKPAKIAELTKQAFYSFLDLIKTGDQKYASEVRKLLNTKIEGTELSKKGEFKKDFLRMLNKRLEGDPGLAIFIDAYKKENKLDPINIIKTVNDLYTFESEEKARKAYGDRLVNTFKTMVLWRLASHAVSTFQSAFDYEKLPSAKEEYRRLEEEFKLFGKPVTDYPYFMSTFQKLFGEKVDKKKFDPLWQAYWEKFGDDITLFGLMESMDDCKNIIEDENKGKKAAQDKYGEKFVSALVDVLGMGLKPVPKVVEPEPVVEEPSKIKFTFK